jgi:hypothetical protein
MIAAGHESTKRCGFWMSRFVWRRASYPEMRADTDDGWRGCRQGCAQFLFGSDRQVTSGPSDVGTSIRCRVERNTKKTVLTKYSPRSCCLLIRRAAEIEPL